MDFTITGASSNISSGNIKPITSNIGLTISENGASQYYLYTNENIEITNIDVKAIFSGYTPSDDFTPVPILENNNPTRFPTWEEDDRYTFSVRVTKKNDGLSFNNKYLHSVAIKLINSPRISSISQSPLCLRLYIYYSLNGEDRRIVVQTKKPHVITNDEYLVYRSNTYTKRKEWPYTIQLDSIYRPFFFNAALLFFECGDINNKDITNDTNFNNISGNTCGKFYFSIANGCTMRDEKSIIPLYKIGDINLKINYNNSTNKDYELTLKNNYRVFSEIEDFNNENKDEKRRELLREAHIRGIRECGIEDKLYDYNNDGIKGGIYLPKIDNNNYLVTEQSYGQTLIPNSIKYFVEEIKEDNEVDVYNLFSAQTFNTNTSFNVNFSVNDASLNGLDFKTREVVCENIKFPKIERTRQQYLNFRYSCDYSDYNNITFLFFDDYDNSKLLGLLNLIGNLSSNDNNNKDVFSFLRDRHGDSLMDFVFNTTTQKYECIRESVTGINYILAVYHGGYNNKEIYDEDGNIELLNCVKDTNKLLIMKLYKFQIYD